MARGMRVVSVATAVLMTTGLGFALTDPTGPAATSADSVLTDTSGAWGRPGDRGARGRDRAASRADRPAAVTPAPAPARVPSTTSPTPEASTAAGGAAGGPTDGTATAPAPAATTPAQAAPTPTRQSAPAQQVAPAPQAAPAPPASAAVAAASMPHRSGLPWRSGVYMPGSNAGTFDAFGTWRGRPLDVVVDWSARQNWSEIVNPDWLYRAWAGTAHTKVFGVAMVPEADGSATVARCATGAYDDKWREFGRNIAAAGLAGSTIVRLGWEFNGDWYKWTARDPQAWAQCWREIVGAAEETAPALRWEWTVNRGVSAGLRDARQAWPGDAYVDIVGIDSYDMYPGVHTEAQWQQHLSGEYGLQFWADFARAHGKSLSVPEWGVYPGTLHAGNNGGDNPFYIQKMFEFFRSLGPLLAYEAYFNDKGSYYAGSLFSPVQAPQAAATYRRLYAGG
jgi:hypothetical protein